MTMFSCNNDAETVACAVAFSDGTDTAHLVHTMMRVPLLDSDVRAKAVMGYIKRANVRTAVARLFVKDRHLCDVMDGMNVKEWLYALSCFLTQRSDHTYDYRLDGYNVELLVESEYLRIARDSKITETVSAWFDDGRLSSEAFSDQLLGYDPFLNVTFDDEIYKINISRSRGTRISKKQKGRVALIKTTIARLEKKVLHIHVNFAPTAIEHVIGEWIESIDLESCDKQTRDAHMLAYMGWMQTHRMLQNTFSLADYVVASNLFGDSELIVVD